MPNQFCSSEQMVTRAKNSQHLDYTNMLLIGQIYDIPCSLYHYAK